MKAHVNLLGGKLFDFIPHCLGLQDSGCKKLLINGYGGDANKALVLSQMLKNIGKSSAYKIDANIAEIKTNYAPISMITAGMEIQSKNVLVGEMSDEDHSKLIKNGFVDFSTYHLLLWNLLSERREINISIDSPRGGALELLTIRRSDKTPEEIEVEVTLQEPNMNTTSDKINTYRMKESRERDAAWRKGVEHASQVLWRKNNSHLISALYRCGFVLPENWEQIGLTLTEYDDVIIGLDTNLIQDAFVTTTLLPVLSVIERQIYLQTPNWLLLVVPKMAIYEIERAANFRTEKKELSHAARRGYRALQEMMELRKNFDQKGVSVVNAGEPDGMLDMNTFLKSINDNLYQLVEKSGAFSPGSRSPKSSTADMIIRTQFKSFVDEFNFGKGAYFMTADKVNAAMFAAQGNNSIYVSKPHFLKGKTISPPELIPKVKKTIPLGTLIYELTTEFSKIYFKIDDNTVVRLECDSKGQSLSPWTKRQLRIPEHRDFLALMKNYTGSFNLVEVQKAYNQISNQLENVNWINDDYADYDDDENDTDELG